ncbi:hypothetical protein [Kitasatospora sp. NPDC090308]|uniref:hypothetical protein n=1 Tax=Kitasatospora sp. NPDC090308 TaxID=3364082 RepID=UPI003817407A
MDLLLWWYGEAWSWSDWASSFGLGAVTTMIVGMLLARRQGNIQEALADLELTEKVAILTSSVPELREASTPGLTYRSLYDCRAGLSLVPLARASMQEEYLQTIARVLETLKENLGSSLLSHTHWMDDNWADLATAIEKLRETAMLNTEKSTIMANRWRGELDSKT